MARRYRSEDGREWEVTLEIPGEVMPVPASMENSGALVPQQSVYIVFTSGDERLSEAYTELAELEDLSKDDLDEWFHAAREQEGT